MHGNVWAWVEDVFHLDYNGAPTNGSAWLENGDAKRRMIRGGAWNAKPENLRANYRNSAFADSPYPDLGFRVARTLKR